ncbi:MAG: hypothetical protein GJT30_04010 [Geobacter sp.]|nr:hypothetical protein [Geobacter sp.]MSM38772.1 hypothetical protein [Geobacter sp.]
MNLPQGLGDKAIQDVIATDPAIGEILARYDIGCVTCKVGICLLKDVVKIHGLTPEAEAAVAIDIESYLNEKTV